MAVDIIARAMAANAMSGGGGGTGGSGLFVVTMTGSNPWQIDKTYDEIKAAYDNGDVIYLFFYDWAIGNVCRFTNEDFFTGFDTLLSVYSWDNHDSKDYMTPVFYVITLGNDDTFSVEQRTAVNELECTVVTQ